MRCCHEFCGYRERTLGNVDRPGILGPCPSAAFAEALGKPWALLDAPRGGA
jgi:hypothetical protein